MRVTGGKPMHEGAGVGPGDENLAALIHLAPRLNDVGSAQVRVAEWLAALAGEEAGKALQALFAAHPTVNRLIESLAESSPFLWELASTEPERLLRLLKSDPDSHLAALLTQNAAAVAATDDEAEAMRLLRRMKAEAALLIALADIGGVWPVMRAARALTDLADTAVAAAAGFALADAGRAGRLTLRDPARPQERSGYIVLAMGKMGAFELNYSSDIDLMVFYDQASPIVHGSCGAGDRVRAGDAAAGEAAARTHRRRLCVPYRPAAAARSGVDRARDLHRLGDRPITKASGKTGNGRR